MSGASSQFRDLAQLEADALEARMRRGQNPDPAVLAGAEYRGANTAFWTGWLRLRQFIKGFERRADGRLVGYNRLVRQDGLAGRWASPSRRFAYFEVRRADPSAADQPYPQALLLDYGAEARTPLDPWRPIRDYLVRAEPGSDELLLGRAFVAWGPLRYSPTYFVLERMGPAQAVR